MPYFCLLKLACTFYLLTLIFVCGWSDSLYFTRRRHQTEGLANQVCIFGCICTLFCPRRESHTRLRRRHCDCHCLPMRLNSRVHNIYIYIYMCSTHQFWRTVCDVIRSRFCRARASGAEFVWCCLLVVRSFFYPHGITRLPVHSSFFLTLSWFLQLCTKCLRLMLSYQIRCEYISQTVHCLSVMVIFSFSFLN